MDWLEKSGEQFAMDHDPFIIDDQHISTFIIDDPFIIDDHNRFIIDNQHLPMNHGDFPVFSTFNTQRAGYPKSYGRHQGRTPEASPRTRGAGDSNGM